MLMKFKEMLLRTAVALTPGVMAIDALAIAPTDQTMRTMSLSETKGKVRTIVDSGTDIIVYGAFAVGFIFVVSGVMKITKENSSEQGRNKAAGWWLIGGGGALFSLGAWAGFAAGLWN